MQERYQGGAYTVIDHTRKEPPPGRLFGKRRLRTMFAVVQVALSLVLVIGAGLFLRSLSKLRAVAYGPWSRCKSCA